MVSHCTLQSIGATLRDTKTLVQLPTITSFVHCRTRI